MRRRVCFATAISRAIVVLAKPRFAGNAKGEWVDLQHEPTAEAPDELEKLLSGGAGALLDALMAYAPVGITIARPPDVKILRVSDAGSRLLQRSRETLEGIAVETHPEAYRVSNPETGAMAAPEELPLTRATLDGEVVEGEEWVVTAEDGRQVTILCNAGPIRDEAGAIPGGIICWADISRQKMLEEHLREAVAVRDTLLAELHHRVRNHLQIVGSIIRAEGREAGEEGRALGDRLEQRLNALTASYSALEGADSDAISADQFLHQVCDPLASRTVTVEVEADPSIEVSTRASPILGISPAAALHDGSGSKLIARLARQLGGTVELRPNPAGGATLSVSLRRI